MEEAADDGGTVDDAGIWLLGAALDGLPCDAGGIELGAWWEALPWDDTSGVPDSGMLDSGRSELSRAEELGRLDTSGNDAVGSNDDKLAVDVGVDSSGAPPDDVTATIITIIMVRTASISPTAITVFFGFNFLFSSILYTSKKQ